MPKNIWQWLFYPVYFIQRQTLVSEVPFQDSRLAITYLLIILLIVVIIFRAVSKRNLVF
ncbi:MAG UNVERIFIED_CONTAM: hypothetical protein LVR29_13400 [Microcystis novacekii LVE1205-3]